MNQFASSAVRITNPTQLQHYPDTNAVLGGRTLDEYLAAAGGRQLGTVIPDDFVQPYASEHHDGHRMAGQSNDHARRRLHSFVWRPIRSARPIVNLPPSGAITTANPRPVAELHPGHHGRELHQELVRRSRNAVALANQVMRLVFRCPTRCRAAISMASTSFSTMRGTQRTPHERGYNPSDQRHNLAIAGTVASAMVYAGERNPEADQRIADENAISRDLSWTADLSAIGDLARSDIPITVGRERVDDITVGDQCVSCDARPGADRSVTVVPGSL